MNTTGKRLGLGLTALAVVAALGVRAQRTDAADTTGEPSVGGGAAVATVMEFGSTQCAGCKAMHAELAQLRAECPNEPVVVEVDVFEDRQAATRHEVSIIPTQVLFDAAGEEVGRHEGFLARADILARLEPHGAACR